MDDLFDQLAEPQARGVAREALVPDEVATQWRQVEGRIDHAQAILREKAGDALGQGQDEVGAADDAGGHHEVWNGDGDAAREALSFELAIDMAGGAAEGRDQGVGQAEEGCAVELAADAGVVFADEANEAIGEELLRIERGAVVQQDHQAEVEVAAREALPESAPGAVDIERDPGRFIAEALDERGNRSEKGTW